MIRHFPLRQYFLTWRGALGVVTAASILALGGALTAQYGFGLEPCVLCLWQRVPYALCLAAALTAFVPPMRPWRGAMLLLCGLLLLADAGIAVFHAGVEQHWWLGTSGCSLQPAAPHDPASLREALLATPVARCDVIAWTFFGLSMAAGNIFFAGLVGLYALCVTFMGKPE